METRVEIFRDGLWRKLKLADGAEIKYNAIVNKIGKPETREISHTNTFSLSNVWQNIDALNINIFNEKSLARALNSRYEAKYYVEDKLIQKGFLVINNTLQGVINVNFIDEALDIVEKWGAITYNELVTSKNLSIPDDYQIAIDEMTDYNMDKLNLVVPLNQVGGRGYNLALYPNNLNTIGDKFQQYDDETRGDDVFNPFQSRPIWNVKSMFDLACQAFGYIPFYDPTVDWDIVEKTYIVDSKVNENQRDDENLSTITQPKVLNFIDAYYSDNFSGSATVFIHPSGQYSLTPQEVSNWVDPPYFQGINANPSGFYEFLPAIYVPLTNESNVGIISYKADALEGIIQELDVYSCWEHTTPGGNVQFKSYPKINNNSTTSVIDFELDKIELDTPPSNGERLIGIICQTRLFSSTVKLENMQIIETYVPSGRIAFDDFGQYISNSISLTHSAPRENLKELLSSYMHKEGILMHIDSNQKVIKFFSYGSYEDRRTLEQFNDWSDYYIKAQVPNFNTNYGNSYAKINRIGLTSPYVGNTFDLLITNQGSISKYKDFTKSVVKRFKDISKIVNVTNTNTPYFEYENKGTGLVEEILGGLGTLTQVSANKNNQGTFTNLPAIANVNYAILPNGVIEWYRLVDRAARTEAKFLIPVSEIKTLDLTLPVYIEDLGGFWIIEEIPEYSNSRTPVIIKLIKLIDDLKENDLVPVIDLTPPTIGVLSITSQDITLTSIPLTWTPATDDGSVTGYRIFQDNVEIIELANVLEHVVTGLTQNQAHNFEIEARDFAGNWSARSNLVVGTPGDFIDPTVPTMTQTGVVTDNSIEVTWTPGTDNIAVQGYEIYRNSVLIATVGNVLTYLDTGLTTWTFYGYKVKTIDTSGNKSPFPAETNIRTLDNIPPVIGTLSSPSNTSASADLTWTAATDNANFPDGVTNYEVWKDNVLLVTLGDVTAYSAINLTASTVYAFKIKAIDGAGNESAFSNIVNVTTTSPPSVNAVTMGSFGFLNSSDSCNLTGSNTLTRYTTGGNLPQIGDIIYTDSGATSLYNGQGRWHKFIISNFAAQISATGEILANSLCGF